MKIFTYTEILDHHVEKALKEQLIDNYLDICTEKLNTIAYECVFC